MNIYTVSWTSTKVMIKLYAVFFAIIPISEFINIYKLTLYQTIHCMSTSTCCNYNRPYAILLFNLLVTECSYNLWTKIQVFSSTEVYKHSKPEWFHLLHYRSFNMQSLFPISWQLYTLDHSNLDTKQYINILLDIWKYKLPDPKNVSGSKVLNFIWISFWSTSNSFKMTTCNIVWKPPCSQLF